MKVVLACRDAPASYYVASRLVRKGLLSAIIVESGKKARKNKIRRMFRGHSIWRIPGNSLNLAFLLMYQTVQNLAIREYVVAKGIELKFPDGIPQCHVDGINDLASKVFLDKQDSDYLVVMGTGLLDAYMIGLPSIAALNIHGGLVPKYRNVHSDFWAYINDDREDIGTSVLYLDEGIDTGDIVCQASAGVGKRDGLFVAKMKNLSLAGELIEKALTHRELIDNRQPQDKDLQCFYPTPGNAAFIRLLWLTIRRSLA